MSEDLTVRRTPPEHGPGWRYAIGDPGEFDPKAEPCGRARPTPWGEFGCTRPPDGHRQHAAHTFTLGVVAVWDDDGDTFVGGDDPGDPPVVLSPTGEVRQ